MPRWVTLLLLGIGVIFLAVGVLVGVFGARQARSHVAYLETLRPLTAISIEDQPAGADALVEGVLSQRNPVVFRDFVAYVGEEMDVTTDSDSDRRETWRSSNRETPPLALEADGIVMLANKSYGIERGHELWYDEATLGINDRPRDGSRRYHGLLAGRPVTAYDTVVRGAEGNELDARTVFGGTLDEYRASQRASAAFLPILGAIFGGVGFVLCAIALVVLILCRR